MQFSIESAIVVACIAAHIPTTTAFSKELSDALRRLALDPTGDGWTQLSDGDGDGGQLLSLNGADDVIDQVAIPWQQEAELRYELSLAYPAVVAAMQSGPAEQLRSETRNVLAERGCPSLIIPCTSHSTCQQVGCSACLFENPVGVCYGYN
ncbi:hypothetical protein ISF_09420 [Cordyceps fumosorosea ARSEF 2679]|uniref:Uncharacterized protein n=1 Tax=Cordyceps fumosorosea (strain ARSEF 2679) TaxID=1081104 RepID=A0A167J2C8_CORFA|nr:hypothetical protein ISF_09420 [Cordyceps fumosorosea ARSEF 2679]OAA49717.1 hypothetical protein ISF_09420 [Cordyceps fumosorosea ARSEF 2679]